MKRILLTTSAFLSLAVSAFSTIPAEAVWPVPTPPAGANLATFSAPREDWMIRFQSELDRSQGQQFDLVFDGDSITDFWQRVGKEVWDRHYGAFRAIDFGISADKVENLLWRVQHGQVEGMDPKLVVLMIGTNNTLRDSADQIAEGIKVVTAEYLKRCPHAHLLLLAVFPRAEKAADPLRGKIAEINKQITSLQSERVTFMDIGNKFLDADGTMPKEIMADFLHPTLKGYEIWADAIQPVVDKYLPHATSPVEKAR